MIAHLKINASILGGWIFATVVLVIGIFNLLLIHPVPALGYSLLSLVYFPPVNEFLKNKTGITVHAIVKIALGVAIVMFTLGVSDLGEMIDGPM